MIGTYLANHRVYDTHDQRVLADMVFLLIQNIHPKSKNEAPRIFVTRTFIHVTRESELVSLFV